MRDSVRTCSGICGFRLRGLSILLPPTCDFIPFAPFHALPLGLCGVLANSSHGASHHRTASGKSASLGQRLLQNIHFIECIVPRTESLRKHPERTNGTPRSVSDLVHSRALRSVRILERYAHAKRILHAHRVPCIRHRPWTSSTAGQSAPTKQPRPATKPSRNGQSVIDKTSTKHLPGRQPNVNERLQTSTKRQRNVKSRTFSTRIEKRFFGDHQRNAQRVWLTGRP